MVYKNIPTERLQPVMRLRFLLDYLAMVKFLLTGHPRNAIAIIQARIAYKKLKTAYAPIRAANLSKTVVSSIPEIFQQSLIVSFYLKRRKRFQDVME